jgi:2-dehydro-3-deoxyglucarate aldolase
MGSTGQFDDPDFIAAMERIRILCHQANISCGVHVVMPDADELKQRINEGYRFIAYSIDAVILNSAVNFNKNINFKD